MLIKKFTVPALVTLAASFTSGLYYFIFPLSLGPHVILEPWLINHGFLIYNQLTDNHSPLMPLLLSVGQLVIPDGLRLAKLVLVGLIFIITLLTFFCARQLAGNTAGVLAALFFVCWSQTFGFDKLWHETFLTPFYLLILLIWTSPAINGRHVLKNFICGLILGIAFLFKQQALFPLAALLAYETLIGLLTHKKAKAIISEILIVISGALIPVIVFIAIYLLVGGSFSKMVYWTILFNDLTMRDMLFQLPKLSFLQIISPAFILFILFVYKFLWKLRNIVEKWSSDGMLILIFLSGLITAYPRFEPFHLQPMLPALAIISGLVLTRFFTGDSTSISDNKLNLGIISAFVIFWLAFGITGMVNSYKPGETRSIHEYSDLPPIAFQIRQQIGMDACIYLLPEDEANSNLYYLLNCQPPLFWAFTSYPWLSRGNLPDQEISALEKADPEWVLYFPGRWAVESHNPRLVSYVATNYQKVTQINSNQGEIWVMKHNP